MYQKIIEIQGNKILCSINAKYLNKKFTLTNAYRIFKKNIAEHSRFVDVKPPFTLLIEMHTRKDIDNTLKAILDALQCKLGNDKSILRILIDKVEITKKKVPEKLVIYVCTKNNKSFMDLLKMGIL